MVGEQLDTKTPAFYDNNEFLSTHFHAKIPDWIMIMKKT